MKKEIKKPVFNLKEEALYLGISTPTLAALLRSGEIPCRRAGHRWLISRAALDNWLNVSGRNN